MTDNQDVGYDICGLPVFSTLPRLRAGAVSPQGGGETVRQYEVMYILNADLDEEATTALMDKFSDLIAGRGGEITKTDVWGKRRLAYEIKHKREGFYVVFEFKGDADAAAELDRVFRITDGVLRHIIIRKD